jgi:P27 family predicted phage terminase small subunit
MGARGPKPLPENVKAFTGTSRRPLRAADLADGVHPEVAEPSMPKHLSPEAAKEWRRIVPLLLELNLLTQIDRSALELYVRAYGRLQQVERALSARQKQLAAKDQDPTEALFQATPTGFLRESVLSKLAADLSQQVDRYLASFGMSPSSRSRVTASRNDAQYRLPGMDDEGDGRQAGFASF